VCQLGGPSIASSPLIWAVDFPLPRGFAPSVDNLSFRPADLRAQRTLFYLVSEPTGVPERRINVQVSDVDHCRRTRSAITKRQKDETAKG
jgi:hypothetical protein